MLIYMGVKEYFGGRETPLNADIVYCEKYKECSFYKNWDDCDNTTKQLILEQKQLFLKK